MKEAQWLWAIDLGPEWGLAGIYYWGPVDPPAVCAGRVALFRTRKEARQRAVNARLLQAWRPRKERFARVVRVKVTTVKMGA